MNEFFGCHSGAYYVYSLLGCDAMQYGREVSGNMPLSSTLMMEAACSIQTTGTQVPDCIVSYPLRLQFLEKHTLLNNTMQHTKTPRTYCNKDEL